mmetsp:Transcript_13165/g.48008  ORF Transcript_13165/g.48008 Transcript_13165/m.48008 type:complete len:344 (-) Transcript_13165:109-1140(-)
MREATLLWPRLFSVAFLLLSLAPPVNSTLGRRCVNDTESVPKVALTDYEFAHQANKCRWCLRYFNEQFWTHVGSIYIVDACERMKNYRLSDRVRQHPHMCKNDDLCLDVFERIFGDSIATRFYRAVRDAQLPREKVESLDARFEIAAQATIDWAIANDLYRNATNPSAPAPDNATALIHTRLGDVVESSKYNASTIFNQRTCFRNYAYVKPKAYHQEVAEQLHALNVNKVEFVGSTYHLNANNKKSLQYMSLLQQFYETEGFSTSLRLSSMYEVDEDLAYDIQASYAVTGDHGFSFLIAEMIRRHGGTIITSYDPYAYFYGDAAFGCKKNPQDMSDIQPLLVG